jgi:hypothetical protein
MTPTISKPSQCEFALQRRHGIDDVFERAINFGLRFLVVLCGRATSTRAITYNHLVASETCPHDNVSLGPRAHPFVTNASYDVDVGKGSDVVGLAYANSRLA